MKHKISGFLFGTFLSLSAVAQSDSQQQTLACERCLVVLEDIRHALLQRCDNVPAQAELRRQTVYLFLSIFDEVSDGIDQQMTGRIYQAALDGMKCDDLDAGVKAAQKMANRVMFESGS